MYFSRTSNALAIGMAQGRPGIGLAPITYPLTEDHRVLVKLLDQDVFSDMAYNISK